jgi:hypothetical protein
VMRRGGDAVVVAANVSGSLVGVWRWCGDVVVVVANVSGILGVWTWCGDVVVVAANVSGGIGGGFGGDEAVRCRCGGVWMWRSACGWCSVWREIFLHTWFSNHFSNLLRFAWLFLCRRWFTNLLTFAVSLHLVDLYCVSVDCLEAVRLIVLDSHSTHAP